MKTLCIFLIVLFSSHSAFTQVVAVTKKSTSTEMEMPTANENPAAVTTDVRAVKELSNKMKKYLRLPDRVIEVNMSGRALFNVHVDADGKIAEVETVQSLGGDVDDSIIRAIKRVKKVKPLVINGKKQARTIQLPVVIK